MRGAAETVAREIAELERQAADDARTLPERRLARILADLLILLTAEVPDRWLLRLAVWLIVVWGLRRRG